MDAKGAVEVWKNTAAGMRWAEVQDRQGKGTSRLVKGGRTFVITPFDRQLNQDAAASSQQDHFRNGTFVLVKAADDTDMSEIESPDSLTDAEILGIVHDLMAKNITPELALTGITSPIALNRIFGRAVAEDLGPNVIKVIKAKLQEAEGTPVVVERELIAEAQKPEPEVKTPRGGIPEKETEKVVKTRPTKAG